MLYPFLVILNIRTESDACGIMSSWVIEADILFLSWEHIYLEWCLITVGTQV